MTDTNNNRIGENSPQFVSVGGPLDRVTVQYRVDLFCGVFLNEGSWNRGFSLSPKVLKELAERNLEIGFDIYAP